jgi:hypothetical protein
MPKRWRLPAITAASPTINANVPATIKKPAISVPLVATTILRFVVRLPSRRLCCCQRYGSPAYAFERASPMPRVLSSQSDSHHATWARRHAASVFWHADGVRTQTIAAPMLPGKHDFCGQFLPSALLVVGRSDRPRISLAFAHAVDYS